MKREGRYLIGGRFLVKWDSPGYWSVEDLKGDLIDFMLSNAYKGDDVYWVLDVKLVSSGEVIGEVVIKGNEVVSYSILEDDKFYINHYGQEFFGRVKVGRRNDISIDGKDLEVRKKEEDTVGLTYIFLGEKLTPMISVIGERSKVVCFPEFSKVYSGSIDVEGCGGCVNVWVLRNRMLSLYLLFGNGEEYLVYEGSYTNPLLSNMPRLHRMANIMVVNFSGKENEIVKSLRRTPGFPYLYAKKAIYGDVYISFDLKKWENLGEMDKLIFKGGEMIIGFGTL